LLSEVEANFFYNFKLTHPDASGANYQNNPIPNLSEEWPLRKQVLLSRDFFTYSHTQKQKSPGFHPGIFKTI
jgi:hypothetical protein